MSAVSEVVWAGGTRPPGDETRIHPNAIRPSDVLVLIGSAVSALALVWLLYTQIAPFSGSLGFVLIWFVAFILMYWVCVRELEGPLIAADRTVAAVLGSIAIGLLIALVSVVAFVFQKGWEFLSTHFLANDMASTGPLAPGSSGGALHAIVGTLEQVGIAIVICVPIGIATAVYMNEVHGRLTLAVRTFVNAMSGTPSIVAGLFIFAVWIIQFHHTFSGFAASLALSILMLPTVTRTSEEVLRLVPDGLREASLALGSPEWRTTWSVVLPTARSGLITAVILGVARAVGETAPLIMTSFGSNVLNKDPFSDPQQSLPLYVWSQYQLQSHGALGRAFTGALVLIMLVLILFSLARLIGRSKVAR